MISRTDWERDRARRIERLVQEVTELDQKIISQDAVLETLTIDRDDRLAELQGLEESSYDDFRADAAFDQTKALRKGEL